MSITVLIGLLSEGFYKPMNDTFIFLLFLMRRVQLSPFDFAFDRFTLNSGELKLGRMRDLVSIS